MAISSFTPDWFLSVPLILGSSLCGSTFMFCVLYLGATENISVSPALLLLMKVLLTYLDQSLPFMIPEKGSDDNTER